MIECVPSVVAKKVTEALQIPVIGIGAGPHTSGQVLVYHDLLVSVLYVYRMHHIYLPTFIVITLFSNTAFRFFIIICLSACFHAGCNASPTSSKACSVFLQTIRPARAAYTYRALPIQRGSTLICLPYGAGVQPLQDVRRRGRKILVKFAVRRKRSAGRFCEDR